jgi:hypothetical protein
MNTEADPVVGNWYRHLDKGQCFQVVAVDEALGTVEIQHFDGDLEEIDIDVWRQTPLEPADEPENWSGAFDVGELDDLTGTEVTDTPPEDWVEPLDEQPRRDLRPWEETAEEQGDDWDEGSMQEEPLPEEAASEGPILAEERSKPRIPRAYDEDE